MAQGKRPPNGRAPCRPHGQWAAGGGAGGAGSPAGSCQSPEVAPCPCARRPLKGQRAPEAPPGPPRTGANSSRVPLPGREAAEPLRAAGTRRDPPGPAGRSQAVREPQLGRRWAAQRSARRWREQGAAQRCPLGKFQHELAKKFNFLKRGLPEALPAPAPSSALRGSPRYCS